MFRINHTDPWVRGDPYRTSRTISLQNMRTSGNPVHGRAPDDVGRGAAADSQASEGNIIVAKTTGGVEYGRPLATGWTGTAGLNWQRSKCMDDHGRVVTEASNLSRILRTRSPAVVLPASIHLLRLAVLYCTAVLLRHVSLTTVCALAIEWLAADQPCPTQLERKVLTECRFCSRMHTEARSHSAAVRATA